MKTYKEFITKTKELDEGLGTIAKVALKGAVKLGKKTPIFKKAGKVIKNLISKPKPKPSDYVRMYHGTTEKAAKNILKTGMRGSRKNPVSSGVYDNSAIFKRRGFVTDSPNIAKDYTMQHEYLGKKPDIVAVKVLKKNLKKGTNPGEYTAPVKDIKPVARGVKPIETRKGQVMQDEYTNKKDNIVELNKFEKFLFKQGVKAIKKLNPRMPLKTIKKDALRTTKGLRSDVDNPFVSPRREAENMVKKFQKTVPGQKGANIMQTRSGSYVNYDPTRVRQGDDMGTAAVGAFSMRGQSKKAIRDMDKNLKSLGKKSDNARSILKNTGDQHSAIYKAPAYRVNPTDEKIDFIFKKNVLGAPTTTNIPKDEIKNLKKYTPAKEVKARSKIKKFKRDKK